MAFTEIFENCTDSELQDLYNRDNFFRDDVEATSLNLFSVRIFT